MQRQRSGVMAMQSTTHHNTHIEGADLNRHRRAWSGSQVIYSGTVVMTRRLSDYPTTRQQARESHLPRNVHHDLAG